MIPLLLGKIFSIYFLFRLLTDLYTYRYLIVKLISHLILLNLITIIYLIILYFLKRYINENEIIKRKNIFKESILGYRSIYNKNTQRIIYSQKNIWLLLYSDIFIILLEIFFTKVDIFSLYIGILSFYTFISIYTSYFIFKVRKKGIDIYEIYDFPQWLYWIVILLSFFGYIFTIILDM